MELKTKNGYYFLIDDEDYHLVKDINWCVYDNGYVVGWCGKRKKRIRIHRLIMGVENETKPLIDHKDRNKLNNQKSNLRFCTHSENLKNQTPSGKSKYLGVSYIHYKRIRKNKSGIQSIYELHRFRVQITVDGKLIRLGEFSDEIEAAKKYNEYAKKHHGEFANLNKI